MTSDSDPRDQSLGKLLAEYLIESDQGQTYDWQQLESDHPDLAHELEGFFQQQEQLHRTAARLRKPASQSNADTSTEDVTLQEANDPPDAPTIAPADVHLASQSIDRGRFGDYELLEEIERGGMGVVYKARQISLNRVVAIKMILAGHLASEEDVKRFRAEAEAAANLDHSGIVPIYEVGEFAGQHYYSMSYIEGISLATKIAEGPLPPLLAAGIIQKTAVAVAFAHKHGVIHRDLKPANVLLDSNGQPKVADFGLAKRVKADSNMTRTGQILGTPSFMPPEQASGQHHEIKETADVYSLGAILYALITGRPPFQADNQLDTLLQVLEQQPVSPRTLNPKIPRDLETICLKCLEKNYRKRYASANELADELARFVKDEPIEARPLSAPVRAWRCCVRKPIIASLTTLASISLLLGTGFSTYFAIVARDKADAAIVAQARERAHRQKAEKAQQKEHQMRLESLESSAKFAARTIANQIDVRWRILEKMAEAPELRQALPEVNTDPSVEANWLQVQEWLDAEAEEHQLLRVRSLFINAIDGTQVARAPSQTEDGERCSSLGGNFNYRDYFHGRGGDFYSEKDLRRPPLQSPHNATVHESSIDGALTVVFSVPIRSTDDNAPIGVLGMSIDLGSFASLEADLPAGQTVLLVDSRNYFMERKYPELHEETGKGLVLHHQDLQDLRDLATLPHVQGDVVDRMISHRKVLAGTPQIFRSNHLIESFDDPLSPSPQSNGSAAFAPVVVMTRPATYSDTGWFVIIQQSQ